MNEPSVAELFDLRGRTAIVTGGAGYLGRSLAAALAEAGARVAVTATTLARAEQAAGKLPRPYDQTHVGIDLDQLDEVQLEARFDQIAKRLGDQVDILINNAHARLTADWTDVTGEDFTRQLANATAYFLLARHTRNLAVQRGASASIVMLGSMYGLVGSYPQVYHGIGPASPAAYHALKGGVVQLTRHLAAMWGGDQVRVNCLSPGPFPSDGAPDELVQRLSDRVPLRRMGQPHELKGAVVFLASDASSYLTGHNLVVDGGWTAW
jgi:gluconate 5-dehydrogenase